MGEPAGATAHGVLLMRSNQPIISLQSSPPRAVVFHRHQPLHPTASATPAAPAAALVAGLVHQRRQMLQCSSPLRGSHTLFAFSFSCSSNSTPLPTTIRCSSSPRSFDSPSISSSGLSNLWIPGSTRKMSQDRLHLRKAAAADEDMNENVIRTRKIVEHVALFKMKDNLTEEQEKEMLDNLWSLQYQVKNVLCTTVGRLVQKTPEGYTHALFSRFPNKQSLDEYMESPVRWRVAQDLVIPFYHGLLTLDFEGEVEDDIETVFRRGDDFQEGVEHFLFFRFKDNVSSDAVDKFVKTANSLPSKFGELVQLTVGENFVSRSKGIYSHGLVARLPSVEVHAQYEKFLQADPSWMEVMELFETSQTLIASFVVSPIGKAVM